MPRTRPVKPGLSLHRDPDHGYEWAEFTPDARPVAEGGGVWMWMRCELAGHVGGHWLAPDYESGGVRVIVQHTPYAWPTLPAALGAWNRYAAQEQGKP